MNTSNDSKRLKLNRDQLRILASSEVNNDAPCSAVSMNSECLTCLTVGFTCVCPPRQ